MRIQSVLLLLALSAVRGYHAGDASIENPDRVQAANELTAFANAFTQTNRLIHDSDLKR